MSLEYLGVGRAGCRVEGQPEAFSSEVDLRAPTNPVQTGTCSPPLSFKVFRSLPHAPRGTTHSADLVQFDLFRRSLRSVVELVRDQGGVGPNC